MYTDVDLVGLFMFVLAYAADNAGKAIALKCEVPVT